MTSVHIVLPNDIDDPSRPSGGNRYDRKVCGGLAALGWQVREHSVHGAWPRAGTEGRTELARLLARLPDRSLVLLDGLIGSTVPDLLAPNADRLRLVILVHLPLGHASEELRALEGDSLAFAAATIATSEWARRRLLELYRLPADRVSVAAPGVEGGAIVRGSDPGSRLLCVAAVAAHKGHDVLVEALATVPKGEWSCVCVGPLDQDPEFVSRVRERARAHGIGDRLRLLGARTERQLEALYGDADLLVHASRGETYGMVVTEALARGIPVLATAVNGLPEALGRASDGSLPGMLVPPDDPVALAGALRRWLADAELRRAVRASAHARRATLSGWQRTSELIASILSTVDSRVSVRR